MGAVTETTTIERELEVAASPETVWELLTDPQEATRWMGMKAAFDVRPGGEYRVEVVPDNVAVGEFVEIDRPRRLVFTWGWESSDVSSVPPGSTTIEFDLAVSDAGTLLRFRHSGLPTVDAAERHGHGWDHYFGRLSVAATGADPGVDPWTTGEMD